MSFAIMENFHQHEFKYERRHGVVWVCDIEGSTKLLNDDSTADAIEEYLPRLHWLARAAVDATGGRFIKWTGDGFLAWFPYELDRELGTRGATVLEMAWHLTVINNVTTLGVNTKRKFRLRHAVAVERDALVTRIVNGQTESVDLIGRGVVLAFRMASIPAAFPGIIAHKEITDAASEKKLLPGVDFKRLKVSAQDRLKYFKGEKWGTGSLVASSGKQPRQKSLRGILRHSKKLIADVKAGERRSESLLKLVEYMQAGPTWSQSAIVEYARFSREDLMGTLERVVQDLEPFSKRQGPNRRQGQGSAPDHGQE